MAIRVAGDLRELSTGSKHVERPTKATDLQLEQLSVPEAANVALGAMPPAPLPGQTQGSHAESQKSQVERVSSQAAEIVLPRYNVRAQRALLITKPATTPKVANTSTVSEVEHVRRLDACPRGNPLVDGVFTWGHLLCSASVVLLLSCSEPKVFLLATYCSTLLSSLQFVLRSGPAKREGLSPSDTFRYTKPVASVSGGVCLAASVSHALITAVNWGVNPAFTASAAFCAVSSLYMAWQLYPSRKR